MKLPQGTQPGSEFRIRGKGVPHINSNRRGDIRVLVDVRVPGSLDKHQRELLEELARSFNGEQPKSRNGSANGRAKTRSSKQPEESTENDAKNSTENSTENDAATNEAQEKGLFDRIKDAF